MMITRLAPDFSVSPQITPEDLPLLKEAGFRAIVNNRPDGEEAGQPSDGDLRREAHRLGLVYVHIPIVPGHMSEDDAQTLREAVAQAGGPVLAFCRTGNRSTRLWELARRRG